MDGISIMDERYGRAVCNIEKVKHKGTIWVLRQLMINGSISRDEARDHLDRLIENGWYCSTGFYSKVMRIFQGRS